MEQNKGLNPKILKLVDNGLLLGLALAIIGAAFKLKYMPYANQLLIVGIGTIVNCVWIKYLALKTLDGYLTAAAISASCLAVLFKLMHWPGSQLLLEIAVVSGLALGVKAFFFATKDKEED